MPLRVISRAQYLSEAVENMRGGDYDATHMVKATKGLQLHPNAYTRVQINGAWVRIKEANKDRAIEWFAEWAAPIIDGLARGQKVLIPVPSSGVVRDSAPDYRPKILADAIAARVQGQVAVAPALRWRRPMVPSRQGGPRDPHALYPELIVVEPIPPGLCVLVDDVATTGGHFIACAWKLEDNNRRVLAAVCCGRTTHRQLEDPFSVPEEILDTSR